MKTKYKLPFLLLFSFALGFAMKCVMSYFGFYLLSFPSIIRTQSASPYGGIQELNDIADNTALPPRRRAEAIFSLFAHHISPGDTSAAVRSTITSTKWLQDARVTARDLIFLNAALDCPDDCSVMTFQLFDKHPEAGHWEIDLCFKGDGSESDAIKFLDNSREQASFEKINSFVLRYAHPLPTGYSVRNRIEVFNSWRMIVIPRSP